MNTTIKLHHKTEDFESISSFSWKDNKAMFLRCVETDLSSGETEILSKEDDIYSLQDDIEIIELYLKSSGAHLLDIASDIKGDICLTKELWMFDDAAITESWIQKDTLVMLKKNTKTEFFNISKEEYLIAN